jgi:hypothetical protein
VHAATEAKAEGDRRLTLTHSSGRAIEYRVEGSGLARTEREADKIRRRESFRTFPKMGARVVVNDGDGPAVAVIVLDRPAGRGGAALDGLRIEAIVGRDRRFVSKGAN